MEQVKLSIRFFLDWQEYFAAQEFFRRHRYNLAPEKIVGGLLLLGSALWFLLGGLPLAAIGVFALGLIIIFAAPWVRRWNWRRRWQREPLFHTEHRVSFDEDGIHFLMGTVESQLVWHYYQRWLESNAGFLLIYGNDSFSFFPKRAFASEQMINDFRALAAKKLKSRL